MPLIAIQVDIIAPSWIPMGILNIKVLLAALAIILISMDKKFIMMIINFQWTLYISSINKVQDRWDLPKKKHRFHLHYAYTVSSFRLGIIFKEFSKSFLMNWSSSFKVLTNLRLYFLGRCLLQPIMIMCLTRTWCFSDHCEGSNIFLLGNYYWFTLSFQDKFYFPN